MTVAGINTQMMAKQASDTREIIRFKQEMDGLKERLAGDSGENREKELREACQDFEAVFISKLWKGMKSTVPKEGYLHSKQEEQYMSMFDREFAEKMSRSGGIGLADMIYDQLSQKLKETSKTTMGGAVDIRPLSGQAIPLNANKGPIPLQEKQPMTLEDWGGDSIPVAKSEGESASVFSGGNISQSTASRAPITDVEVKAQLDQLARKLEAERIKAGLLGTQPQKSGQMYQRESDAQVGRELADIS